MAKYKLIRKCNICEIENKMSNDHVPPKICKNKGRIETYTIFEPVNDAKPAVFQNGVYFQSICENCNNEKLGHNYDPFLGLFTDSIADVIDKTDNIESKIKCKINRVTRAVVGHFLASFNEYNSSGYVDVEMRKYFLDNTYLNMPGFHLYCGTYNHNSIVVARNFGIMGNSPFNEAVISVLKFWPVMFILSDKKINERLVDLFEYTTADIDDEIEVNVDMESYKYQNDQIREEEWPLQINDDYIFIISPNALDYTKKGKINFI